MTKEEYEFEIEKELEGFRKIGYRSSLLAPAQVKAIVGKSISTLESDRMRSTGIPYIKGPGKKGGVLYRARSVAKWIVDREIKTA